MTARLIPTGSEAEWLAARKYGITASEIPVIMGLTTWSSPFKLWHQKTGALPGDGDTLRLAAGRHLEPLIVEEFSDRHPEFTAWGDGRTLLAHPDRSWQLATPDRVVCESREPYPSYASAYGPAVAVLECKTSATYEDWGEDGTSDIPVHYRAQVLWQMDVLGVTAGYVACLFTHSWKIRVYELTLDDAALADLKLMREEARDFLESIDLGTPPDVDWRPATTETLKALHPAVEDRDAHIGRQLEISYRAAVRRYKTAERRKDEMANRLRQAMGSARRAVAAGTYGTDGDRAVIATRQVYDVREHVRKATTVDKLTPAKPKGETRP